MRKLGTWITVVALMVLPFQQAFSFCGFYVAKADVRLMNKASQVILARDGDKTVVTMSNDFQGDVKDFAMVVPVPTILDESDINVVNRYIFDRLDAYSGPRLVEYHDANPCYDYAEYYRAVPMANQSTKSLEMMDMVEEEVDLGVTIEAQYTVGEYDILILSAEESSGLKTWLTTNGYQIPDEAEEVLDPYIKNNLKFFVAKVNVEEMQNNQSGYLNPIQISYTSDRFMLPIRLGMANAETTQDLIVYAFTKTGRVQTTNYRTVEIPTNKEIPTFVEEQFGQFYADLYNKAYKRNGRNSVFLEYSWDLSSSNFTKCDPCVTTPPTFSEMRDAGVFWAQPNRNGGWGSSDYEGNIYFTRLHVTYDRENFPQDLQFQITPETQNFQGRYVMNHPVKGHLDCEAAAGYYLDVLDRRENEIDNLAYLTGWDTDEYDYYTNSYEKKYKRAKNLNEDKGSFFPAVKLPNNGNGENNAPMVMWLTLLAMIVTTSLLAFKQWRLKIS